MVILLKHNEYTGKDRVDNEYIFRYAFTDVNDKSQGLRVGLTRRRMPQKPSYNNQIVGHRVSSIRVLFSFTEILCVSKLTRTDSLKYLKN